MKQAFFDGADQGQIVGILAEREAWETAGHGQWCFNKPLTCVLCDVGICEEHIKLNVSVQVTPSLNSSSSQTIHHPFLLMLKLKPSSQIQPLLLPLLLPWIPQLSIGLKMLPPHPSSPYSPKVNLTMTFQLSAPPTLVLESLVN